MINTLYQLFKQLTVSEKSKIVKCFSALLKYPSYWVARKVREKSRNSLLKTWQELNVNLINIRCCRIPELQPTRWCPEVQGVQCSETWPRWRRLKHDHYWTRLISQKVKTGPWNIWRQIFMKCEWLRPDGWKYGWIIKDGLVKTTFLGWRWI